MATWATRSRWVKACTRREFFGPGWRMCYVLRGDVLIIMLGGGDQGSQSADIAAAQALAATLKE